MKMFKYPRTQHVEGSNLQPGDHDLSQVRFQALADKYLVIEEKLDGANAGISFDDQGRLLLQSRGHFLTGGPREKHFALFKTWAACHQKALWSLLGSRYLVFGEWVYAKHTIYYNRLPHYFLEFDIYDREQDVFLDTACRHALLAGSPLVSVPVIWRGMGRDCPALTSLVGPAAYKSVGWRNALAAAAQQSGVDPRRAANETDPADLMEGLYLKVEAEGETRDRLKWVRRDFLTSVLDSGSHWLDRPIIPNGLAAHVDIYGGA